MTTKFMAQYKRLGIKVPKTKDPVEKAEIIYDAACKKLCLDPADLPDVSRVREKYRASQLAFHKMEVVRDAITDDREADWNDRGEYKYGGWFWMDSPGFRFHGSYYSFAVSYPTGGSRLCTFSEEDQDFFMIECVSLWADFYGGKLWVGE
jgi:hypothetical protein